MKIAIDAGHGKDTYPLTGAKGVPEMAEFEFNSAVAGYAKTYLEEAGYEVILTQPLNGNSVTLKNRLKIAKENGADFLVSIHADYNSSPKPKGYWIFYWHENEVANKFSEVWLKHADKNFTHPSRGKRAGSPNEWCNFFMNRATHNAGIPGVLIEHGFMSNPDDLKLLMSDNFRKQAAKTIVEAIKEMFPIVMDWRKAIGIKAIHKLNKKGLLNDPEQWIEKLSEPLPAWVTWEMFNRITEKYGLS